MLFLLIIITMAIVQFTTTEFNGSIAGVTYQKNSSGNIARSRPTGKKSGSLKQQIQRNNQNFYLNLWQNLSLADKTEWNDYATLYTKINKYGQVKKLSGWNWFESINYNLTLIGLPTVSTPPLHIVPTAMPLFTVSITITELIITFPVPIIDPDLSYFIFTTPPISTTSKSINNKTIFTHIDTALFLSAIDILPNWETAHGIILADIYSVGGFNIAVQIQLVNNISGIATPSVIVISEAT